GFYEMNATRSIFPFCAIALATFQLSSEDIDAFWKQTRRHLANESMEAQVERVDEPLPFKKFQVTLRSLDGVRFRALMSLPVQGEAPGKPWPVIITICGYSGKQQSIMLSECQRGY